MIGSWITALSLKSFKTFCFLNLVIRSDAFAACLLVLVLLDVQEKEVVSLKPWKNWWFETFDLDVLDDW